MPTSTMTNAPHVTANASPTKLSSALSTFTTAARELRTLIATDARRSVAAGPPLTLLASLRALRAAVDARGAAVAS